MNPLAPGRPEVDSAGTARAQRPGSVTWLTGSRSRPPASSSASDRPAVDGVDLAVPRGCVYGVLGPNGAGKTTTIRVLATLVRPDAGSARVLGRDVAREADAVRALVSLTGQLASVDEELTGRENLLLLGRLLGLGRRSARARADELLGAFGLAEAASRLVKHYSGGMRRRLDIAASLAVTPDVLFLDKPTTGLDPRSRNQVWEIVRALVGSGTTVLLCTQYLEEADQLATGSSSSTAGGSSPRARRHGSRRRSAPARSPCGCRTPRSGPRRPGCSSAGSGRWRWTPTRRR